MHPYLRAILKAGFHGSVMIALASSGCGGIEPTIRQQPPSDRPAIPPITAERLQECVKEHGNQLDPGSWAFSPTIQVNRDGYVVDVNAGEMPQSASDLAACTRMALGDMALPSHIFNLRSTQSDNATNEPIMGQRSFIGSPALVVVVVVGLSEIVLEAGAYTILFAVTVKVVDKAVDDVAELVKRKRDRAWDECLNRYEACVASPLYSEEGKHIRDSRCGLCLGICRSTRKWPAFVDLGPCL